MPLKHACQLQEKRRASLKPHTNHASCLRGLRYNTFTKKTNFSFCPYRSADVRLGKMVWIISVRCALRLIKSSQTSLLTSTNRNNPLVCERSRKRNKSYGIFPSTWYLTASLTRYCCVHVVQPTAPVRSSTSVRRTRVLRVWRGRRASVWRGRADVQLKSFSLCLLESDVIVIRICSTRRPRF